MKTVYKRMIKITYNQTTTTNNKTTQLTCTAKLPLSTNGNGDTPFNVQHHMHTPNSRSHHRIKYDPPRLCGI